MGMTVSTVPDRQVPGAWRVTKNRKATRYRIREKPTGFHVECVDAMHPREQLELFDLIFPHQQAAVHHVYITYLKGH